MANVKLSKEELELVSNAELILTKNRIIQKVYALFGQLSEEYKQMSKGLSSDILAVSPKIAKGENYLGLPWVMLDQPRLFSNTDVFAIRSFFWWGRHFSITLQLQGKYKLQYQEAIVRHLAATKDSEWMIGISDDPWQHHFERSNYVPYDPSIDIQSLPFIKLAKKIPLQQWDNSFSFFTAGFREYCKILGT